MSASRLFVCVRPSKSSENVAAVTGKDEERSDTRSFMESAQTRSMGFVRLTDLTLSCAAKAHVPKPERRGGCRARRSKNPVANSNRRDAVKLAMMRQLGCRAEAGPHQLQREVSRRQALRPWSLALVLTSNDVRRIAST
jgi:hypothetical protein